MSPQRRAAFLKAVRETGNQTIAAERAKVSRSWVQLHRTEDPEFRRELEAAIKAAKESLTWAPDRVRGTRGSNRPPRGWGHLDGEELVVKGTGGSGGGKRVQIARARLKQWTPRVEDRFLAVLAATCNVKAACAAVGMTAASAYAHRQRWPGFMARWDAAIEVAYRRIEVALDQAAEQLLGTCDLPPEEPLGPMNVDQAIHLMHMHKHQVEGLGKAPGAWRRPRTLDEVRGSILRKLRAIATARAANAADKDRDRREWERRGLRVSA
ncbi:MAG TPA: hypothetical protein VGW40_14230 [Allosphingosinicella sp.]|nr:hypothetical protein [Allosphingosinicella sp.]